METTTENTVELDRICGFDDCERKATNMGACQQCMDSKVRKQISSGEKKLSDFIPILGHDDYFLHMVKAEMKRDGVYVRPTCIRRNCDRPASSRGLCLTCYGTSYQKIKAGKMRWIDLISLGLALPTEAEKVGRKNLPSHDALYAKLGIKAKKSYVPPAEVDEAAEPAKLDSPPADDTAADDTQALNPPCESLPVYGHPADDTPPAASPPPWETNPQPEGTIDDSTAKENTKDTEEPNLGLPWNK